MQRSREKALSGNALYTAQNTDTHTHAPPSYLTRCMKDSNTSHTRLLNNKVAGKGPRAPQSLTATPQQQLICLRAHTHTHTAARIKRTTDERAVSGLVWLGRDTATQHYKHSEHVDKINKTHPPAARANRNRPKRRGHSTHATTAELANNTKPAWGLGVRQAHTTTKRRAIIK